MVNGQWSMVIGHWLLVIGHWSMVIGHWSLVKTNDKGRMTNDSPWGRNIVLLVTKCDSKSEKQYYKVLRAVIFAQHNARK